MLLVETPFHTVYDMRFFCHLTKQHVIACSLAYILSPSSDDDKKILVKKELSIDQVYVWSC